MKIPPIHQLQKNQTPEIQFSPEELAFLDFIRDCNEYILVAALTPKMALFLEDLHLLGIIG